MLFSRFNAAGNFTIKLKFQNIFVLELVEKMHPLNACTGELFLDGEYKYGARWGYVIITVVHRYC